jgi:PAS domain S-box-containing protein
MQLFPKNKPNNPNTLKQWTHVSRDVYFRHLSQQLPNAVLLVSLPGLEISAANPQASALTGLPNHALLGKPLAELLDFQIETQFFLNSLQNFQDGAIRKFEHVGLVTASNSAQLTRWRVSKIAPELDSAAFLCLIAEKNTNEAPVNHHVWQLTSLSQLQHLLAEQTSLNSVDWARILRQCAECLQASFCGLYLPDEMYEHLHLVDGAPDFLVKTLYNQTLSSGSKSDDDSYNPFELDCQTQCTQLQQDNHAVHCTYQLLTPENARAGILFIAYAQPVRVARQLLMQTQSELVTQTLNYFLRFHKNAQEYKTVQIQNRLLDQQNQILLNKTQEGIVTIDHSGKILQVNSRLCELLGYSETEILKKPLANIFQSADDTILPEILHLLQVGIEKHNWQMQLWNRAGKAIDVELSVSPFTVDPKKQTNYGTLIVEPSVHEQVSSTHAVSGDLYESIFHDVIGSIAHEIQNPLSGVALGVQWLSGAIKTAQPTELIEERIGRILRDCQQVQTLLQEFMDNAKIQKSSFNSQKWGQFFQHSIENWRFRFRPKHGNLYFETYIEPNLPEIYVQSTRLQQLFDNLIKNASESLAQQGGTIALQVRMAPPTTLPDRVHKQTNMIYITVTDNGPGMKPDVLEQLFKIRLTYNKQRGNGFGLLTCKRVVEDHHGQIRVTSQLGVGTTFHIYLPIVQTGPRPSIGLPKE